VAIEANGQLRAVQQDRYSQQSALAAFGRVLVVIAVYVVGAPIVCG
jgi:hypothetical protein